MGQRKEQRIDVSLDVIVRGTDPSGKPFEANVKTHDISCSGAAVYGLAALVEPGAKVELQCKQQMAWYRVQWVDKTFEGQRLAGLRCLEPGKYIWGIAPKAWEPDNYDPSQSPPRPLYANPAPTERITYEGASHDWSRSDRRQFPRATCRMDGYLTMVQGGVQLRGMVTDISLGGCYMEMLAPLPMDTEVEVVLRAGQLMLRALGKVRSSQAGMGMGIAFTKMSPADFEKLQQIAPTVPKPSVVQKRPETKRIAERYEAASADFDPSEPANQPSARAAGPRIVDSNDGPVPSSPEAFQALIRVLFRKGLLTRAELLEEMEKLKLTRAS